MVLEKDFDFFDDVKDLRKASIKAFSRLSFTFTKEHLENVIKAALSPDASENDKYVCSCILKNAQVASKGIFPICQDTGIANIFAWKKGGCSFLNGRNEYDEISEGAAEVYNKRKLRFSTSVPKSFFEEFDPKNNMPTQVSIFSAGGPLAPLPDFVKDAPENSMSFVFCAKGGGSSNKTSFIQGTKAYLSKARFLNLMENEIKHFGTSACPPYTIAVVAGGLSPEQNLLALKLATMGAYNGMTYTPNEFGFRDRELENAALEIASMTGFGAQFGGTRFALDAVVVRLPRHGASCPISFGVSCSAHRNLKAVLTEKGFYLEKTVSNPEELKGFSEAVNQKSQNICINPYGSAVNAAEKSERNVTTKNGIEYVLTQLEGAKPGDRIILSGKILVARDAAHARWQKLIESGKNLPEYTKEHIICYAGPARTPEGKVIGSFGPTTAGRMDVYADSLMSRGAALITLAKGNRSGQWTNACKKYGAFYLGTPGGIAALIAYEYIVSQEVIDYDDLGMEAVRLVEVKNLPCFVITNNKGEDFYANL